ncbi:MAG: protein kinase, partial [Deltaproteobacteria bacterium]|nr:protein kinase [Deltaproteobacteria bacterium]
MELPSRFGKFILKRKLARGGMAEVFLASLPGAEGFEKELVVKLILPELSEDEGFVRRFVDEAKTCVRLTHPNIVSVFELGVEAGVLYMAMELVRGATLTELMQEGGPLGADEGAYVGLEVARALHHAHRRGVLHRDVTPGNVMIDEDGAVKLLDFGIAAPVHGARAKEEIFGTPGHMPLEQMEGGPLGPATDLFALGTVLLEAWTGRAPYRRADAHAARTALLEAEAPLPSRDVATLAPLDDLATALLARDRSSRPQHADDVARVLRQFLGERGADHDEVAARLGRRVAKAVAAREAGGAGRRGAPVPYGLRPTPFAERTQTFATRGDWEPSDGAPASRPSADPAEGTRPIGDAPRTRPIEEVKSGAPERRDEAVVTGPRTRALVEPSAPLAPATSSLRPLFVGLLVLAGVAVAIGLLRRSRPDPVVATADAAPSVSEVAAPLPTPSPSPPTSASSSAPSASA